LLYKGLSYIVLLLLQEGIQDFRLDGNQIALEIFENIDNLEFLQHGYIGALADEFLHKEGTYSKLK
jgi:hypothetical protein